VFVNPALALWEYAVWGAFGGVAVEAIEILGAVKRTKGLPWNQPGEVTLGALLFTVLVRLGLGAGLAAALGEAGQISGGVGAVAAGVAAPLILEQMGKQLSSGEVEGKRRAKEAQARAKESQARAKKGRLRGIERLEESEKCLRIEIDSLKDHRREEPEAIPNASSTLNYGDLHLVRFAREVAFGLVRSTPAFGGTAELCRPTSRGR
jgi:hypothetical protein